MSTHIFVIGRIDRLDTVVRPAHSPDCSDAYTIGEMDRNDRKPCEPLFYYSDLACIEAYICGYNDARHAEHELIPADIVVDTGYEPNWAEYWAHVSKAEAMGSIEDDQDWIRHGC